MNVAVDDMGQDSCEHLVYYHPDTANTRAGVPRDQLKGGCRRRVIRSWMSRSRFSVFPFCRREVPVTRKRETPWKTGAFPCVLLAGHPRQACILRLFPVYTGNRRGYRFGGDCLQHHYFPMLRLVRSHSPARRSMALIRRFCATARCLSPCWRRAELARHAQRPN